MVLWCLMYTEPEVFGEAAAAAVALVPFLCVYARCFFVPNFSRSSTKKGEDDLER